LIIAFGEAGGEAGELAGAEDAGGGVVVSPAPVSRKAKVPTRVDKPGAGESADTRESVGGVESGGVACAAIAPGLGVPPADATAVSSAQSGDVTRTYPEKANTRSHRRKDCLLYEGEKSVIGVERVNGASLH
jgi:hypothetical protein